MHISQFLDLASFVLASDFDTANLLLPSLHATSCILHAYDLLYILEMWFMPLI